jgi:GNAT superfamily N-acetyltransferase
MPHAKAQAMVNVDYRDRMAFVATLGDIGPERIIRAGRYEAEKESQGMIEVAYTIHEIYRRRGIGTILQDRLEGYAQHQGFKGAVGYLFEDNMAMLKTFSREGSYCGDILEDGILRVFRYFYTK